MEVTEENVQTLLNMGFPEDNIRYALKLGKNDLSAAVGILTSDPAEVAHYKTDSLGCDDSTNQMAPPPSYEDITSELANLSEKDKEKVSFNIN